MFATSLLTDSPKLYERYQLNLPGIHPAVCKTCVISKTESLPLSDSPYAPILDPPNRNHRARESFYPADMASRILARIARETGWPRLFPVLAQDLAGSDLQSLLLEVYKTRASAISGPQLLEKAGRGLVAPSGVDARLFLEFDRAAFEVAAGFEAIELSPVAP